LSTLLLYYLPVGEANSIGSLRKNEVRLFQVGCQSYTCLDFHQSVDQLVKP